MAKEGINSTNPIRLALDVVAGLSGIFAPIFYLTGSSSIALLLSALAVGLSVVQLFLAEKAAAAPLAPLALCAVLASLITFFAPTPGNFLGLLTAAGFALQCRIWLLHIAGLRRRETIALADTIGNRKADTAVVFVDNDIESNVSPDALREGNIFRVSPGQRFPADGSVTFGSGFVNEGTEHDDLRLKGMGSPVYAGAKNESGTLLVRTTATGEGTFAARISRALQKTTALKWCWMAEIGTLAVAAILYAVSGPASAFVALFASPLASAFAVFSALDFSLARAAGARRWLWTDQGLSKLSKAGMLVTSAPGVLSEGRPRLAAVETAGRLSEDAALGLIAPLARKLETPAAFAILLEIRSRNIPLQLSDFYEPREGGGFAMIGGEELRWISLDASRRETPPLGELEPFVSEHENAGDELCLLERQGTIQAAFAFRDTPVKGAKDAASELRTAGYPTLLVSPLPKRCTARLKTEFDLEHAQGESAERETESLVSRLVDEKLCPAWVQSGHFRPGRVAAVVALAGAAAHADLLLPDVALPEIAAALTFGKRARQNWKLALAFVFSIQAGLLLALFTADSNIAASLHLGGGWPVNPLAFAVAGVLPGFLAFFLAHTRLENS